MLCASSFFPILRRMSEDCVVNLQFPPICVTVATLSPTVNLDSGPLTRIVPTILKPGMFWSLTGKSLYHSPRRMTQSKYSTEDAFCDNYSSNQFVTFDIFRDNSNISGHLPQSWSNICLLPKILEMHHNVIPSCNCRDSESLNRKLLACFLSEECKY